MRTWNIHNVKQGSKPYYRAFTTFGKQTTDHAKLCGDSTQAHVFVIYW